MVTAPQEETTEEQKRRDLARRDASARVRAEQEQRHVANPPGVGLA